MTWVDLMATVRQRDIVRAGRGKVSGRTAHYWAHHGLPAAPYFGINAKLIVAKAARLHGIDITPREVGKLAAAHRLLHSSKA